LGNKCKKAKGKETKQDKKKNLIVISPVILLELWSFSEPLLLRAERKEFLM